MDHPAITLFIALGSSASLIVKLALKRAGVEQDAPLRRLLAKTEPVPYAVWMAGLAVTFGYPILLFVWALNAGALSQILFLTLLLPCIGCLIGFYITQCMRLRWLATFGDVLRGGKPLTPEDKKKGEFRQSVLALACIVAILCTSIALAFGMGIL